jgi:hypothetical protein
MWEVQGFYTEQYGWECLTHHDTKKEALDEARVYDENEPKIPHRVRPACDE